MLDVHPPEHKIHGVRDFFTHLLTITVGLLIAIALEQTVEWLHHRHQRKEAEAMIREELTQNQQDVRDGGPTLMKEIHAMNAALNSLQDISEGKPGTVQEDGLTFAEGSFRDSAWRTANTTGAVSYMDYAEVERFSDAYKQQELLQGLVLSAVEDYLELLPILKNHETGMTAERAKEALPYARRAIGHLSGMYDLGNGTLTAYESALKK